MVLLAQPYYRSNARGDVMGLVKTRRLAAMQKQQRAKAGMRPPCKDRKVPVPRANFSSAPRRP